MREGSLALSDDADVAAQVLIECSFQVLLTWLHDDRVLLGHLIGSGIPVRGDPFYMSVLDGLISYPFEDTARATFRSASVAYASCLSSASYREVVTRISQRS
jgi:hypothetical protein